MCIFCKDLACKEDLTLQQGCYFSTFLCVDGVIFFQERLIKKLGPNAYPFYFELPPHCPASVTLQPAPGDTGKPCGVDYELKAFVGETLDDKPHKR
jgi:hypothetical protein